LLKLSPYRSICDVCSAAASSLLCCAILYFFTHLYSQGVLMTARHQPRLAMLETACPCQILLIQKPLTQRRFGNVWLAILTDDGSGFPLNLNPTPQNDICYHYYKPVADHPSICIFLALSFFLLLLFIRF